MLAGSAAYAIGKFRQWKCGLDQKPWEAVGFYSVIGVATLLGVVIDWSGLDPIQALFWSAVVNGVVAVPIMIVMMIFATSRAHMGKFRSGRWLTMFGWLATAAMCLASVALFATLFRK